MNEVREEARPGPGAGRWRGGAADLRAQQREQAGCIARQHRRSDVLGHPDARDRVIGSTPHLRVVLDADLDAVGNPRRDHPLRADAACSRDRVTPTTWAP